MPRGHAVTVAGFPQSSSCLSAGKAELPRPLRKAILKDSVFCNKTKLRETIVCLNLSQNLQVQVKFASNMIGAHFGEHILLNKEKSLLPWSVRAASIVESRQAQATETCNSPL